MRNSSPGTVSKILWHFTGGPKWNEKKKRQNLRPKPAKDAYDSLTSILQSGELRLGSYQEVVRVVVPERRTFDRTERGYKVEKDVVEEIASVPVCCLADVPLIHLSYLAGRYGKFALGFHRDAVVAHGFNPVFYTLEDSGIVRSLYRGVSVLEYVDPLLLSWSADEVRNSVESLLTELELDDEPDLYGLDEIDNEARNIEAYVQLARTSFERFLAYVKTFRREEFGTIYCEREWRSVETFRFQPGALAMVVVPKRVGKTKYFDRLVGKSHRVRGLSRSVPIVPWEDLVEH